MARFYPFIRTLAATAADNGAVVVTGGTDAGVIRLLGLSLQSLPEPPRLIGVAPAGLIASDGQASALDGADAEPVAGAGQADSSSASNPTRTMTPSCWSRAPIGVTRPPCSHAW